jgi:ketosteroid isomerase-like protein
MASDNAKSDQGRDIKNVADRFLRAFDNADLATMRQLLADDVVAYITGADGEETRVAGADNYLAAIAAMNLPAVDYSVTTTGAPVLVDPDRLLVMVEVRAARGDRTLHNFAAHLLRVRDGRITQMQMVDAKPAESDAFWA